VLYLEREYPNHLGNADWLIITDLSEEEIQKRFSEIISKYIPYILLSNEQGEPILESIRNNHKHEMRGKRTTEPFDYDDELLPLFHSELLSFVDPLEEKEKIYERAKEENHLDEMIDKVHSTLALMKPIQRDRLIKNVVRGLSSRRIAKEEGVNYSTVDKSIKAAKKNFRRIFEKL
jgi:DNA-directed RNA polymerase specialized sigma24 family protein